MTWRVNCVCSKDAQKQTRRNMPRGRLTFFTECVSQVEQANNISWVLLLFEYLILFFRVSLPFTITWIQMRSAVIPQTGRRTWLNGITLFGSEITRPTGELLADTTQTARYIQITCEPH